MRPLSVQTQGNVPATLTLLSLKEKKKKGSQQNSMYDIILFLQINA